MKKDKCTHNWLELFIRPQDSIGRVDFMLDITLHRLDTFRCCGKCGMLGNVVRGSHTRPLYTKSGIDWLNDKREQFINPLIEQVFKDEMQRKRKED